jgi:hypothetical protein
VGWGKSCQNPGIIISAPGVESLGIDMPHEFMDQGPANCHPREVKCCLVASFLRVIFRMSSNPLRLWEVPSQSWELSLFLHLDEVLSSHQSVIGAAFPKQNESQPTMRTWWKWCHN